MQELPKSRDMRAVDLVGGLVMDRPRVRAVRLAEGEKGRVLLPISMRGVRNCGRVMRRYYDAVFGVEYPPGGDFTCLKRVVRRNLRREDRVPLEQIRVIVGVQELRWIARAMVIDDEDVVVRDHLPPRLYSGSGEYGFLFRAFLLKKTMRTLRRVPVWFVELARLKRMSRAEGPEWLGKWRGFRRVVVCEGCGNYFPSDSDYARTCSGACRTKLSRAGGGVAGD